ncbi:MAG: TIGR04282 family arsenosugar biosynthesis glycosyltransferase [Bacteroidota bacterium]|nr:TIGR04282 family arsenosugar biosynthesis glycosyltransferase [Bacteroidota bacterium]
MKPALIIFVRNPVLAKVKTRLAASLGNEKALEIYKMLLAHTNTISKNLEADKYIFYEDFINTNDIWQNDTYRKELQHGTNLGDRMKNAFDNLFKNGYEKVIIIGSDCYELTNDILNDAFYQLTKNDIVIGPANDGGYYLLGMNQFIPELFKDKKWSSESVYTDTVNQVKKINKKFYNLPLLSDVDEEKDIDYEKLKNLD